MTRRALPLVTIAALAVALALAPGAFGTGSAAPSSGSSKNWSGYAVHRSGTRFAYVTGAWQQPAADCTPGTKSFSAFWVGIGGFSESSTAIEQLGTELDCSAAGTATLTAFYELAPGPMRQITMTVEPGDTMTGAVFADKGHVTLNMSDTTRGEKFARTIPDHHLDQSSAEWIAEAPSSCPGRRCATLPLTNFGSITFSRALAGTTTGRAGRITSPLWNSTQIALTHSSAHASRPADGGRAFTVDY